jgi:hypothetical protein
MYKGQVDQDCTVQGTHRPRVALSKGENIRHFLIGDTSFGDTSVPGGLLNLGKGILLEYSVRWGDFPFAKWRSA